MVLCNRRTPAHESPSELGTDKAPEPKPDPTNDIALTVEPRPLEGVMEATKPIKVLIAAGAVNLTGGLPAHRPRNRHKAFEMG